MKFEELNVTVATLHGVCNDEVKLPNGEKGNIRFNFEWGAEFETLNIQSGALNLSHNTTVTFSRTATGLRTMQVGPGVEGISPSLVVGEYIADFIARLKKAELSVEIKNL